MTWRPGAVELVRELRDRGIPQAIVTTSPRFMTQVVADALPEGAITAIVSGDDVENGKPDPEPYLTAIRELGVDPRRCVAVEDSPTGLASAIAAGVAVVGVPHDAEPTVSAGWTRLASLSGVTVRDLAGVAGLGGSGR